MMGDIFFVAMMIFLSGVSLGLMTALIAEAYYRKQFEKWKKEREKEDDR